MTIENNAVINFNLSNYTYKYSCYSKSTSGRRRGVISVRTLRFENCDGIFVSLLYMGVVYMYIYIYIYILLMKVSPRQEYIKLRRCKGF